MDELTELLDKLETYQPAKSLQQLAKEHPELKGLQQLASREAEAMAAQQSANAQTPTFTSCKPTIRTGT